MRRNFVTLCRGPLGVSEQGKKGSVAVDEHVSAFCRSIGHTPRTRRRRALSTATMSAASFTVKPVMQVRLRPDLLARARPGTLAACPPSFPRRDALVSTRRVHVTHRHLPHLLPSFPQVTRQFASLGNTFTKKAAAVPAKVDTTVQSTYTSIASTRIAARPACQLSRYR